MKKTMKELNQNEMKKIHGGESEGTAYFTWPKQICPDCGGTNIRHWTETKYWLFQAMHWKCLDCNPEGNESSN